MTDQTDFMDEGTHDRKVRVRKISVRILRPIGGARRRISSLLVTKNGFSRDVQSRFVAVDSQIFARLCGA